MTCRASSRDWRCCSSCPRALSKRKILRWADLHHQRTGQWPNVDSGPVLDAPGEHGKWIDNALRQGRRRLTGGSSLLLLLVQKRGLRHPWKPPPLTEEQILRWADRHRQRTGCWPKYQSGTIADAPGETRAGIDSGLRYGNRELGAGSSLAKLLEKSGRQQKAS